MKKPVYITTTLPYVNSDPHVGFAMEIIRADVLARYYKILGHDVFFNTGTDEHGQKLLSDATKAGKDVKEYVDFYAEKFRGLKDLLGISDDVHFIRTTDDHHVYAAQEMWRRVKENGYIYKKNYQTKYCIGCELEKTDSELVEGKCPIHPNKEIELRDEENYFFALSKLSDDLKKLYIDKPELVIPEFRFNEMKAFLERGLQDFSISRPKAKMSWGVPVPDDADHVMYVWFDALTNYISTLGWPEDVKGDYKKFWEEGLKIQYCGKDNVRQQSMMWQAILRAAKLPNTDNIIINGFINSGGQKMSKSLGNVINPYDLIKDYEAVAGDLASDVLRYYLLRHVNPFEDSDMTLETIKEAYQAGLANGLGNVVSRVMKMCSDNNVVLDPETLRDLEDINKSNLYLPYKNSIDNFDLSFSCNEIWKFIQDIDKQINDKKPFSLIKTNKEEALKVLNQVLNYLYRISIMLKPIMPKTSEKIIELIKQNKKPETPLFNRIA
jgi:methionyl-tRNA synthetase